MQIFFFRDKGSVESSIVSFASNKLHINSGKKMEAKKQNTTIDVSFAGKYIRDDIPPIAIMMDNTRRESLDMSI